MEIKDFMANIDTYYLSCSGKSNHPVRHLTDPSGLFFSLLQIREER